MHHEKILWSPCKTKEGCPTHPLQEDLGVQIKNIVTHTHHEKILWSRGKKLNFVMHIHHKKFSWSPGKTKESWPTYPPRENLVGSW